MWARRCFQSLGSPCGFTLIEMLVVLAIIGLIVAVVPPMMRSRAGELRAIAHAVSADLRLLREEAIRRDQRTTFVPLEAGYALRPSGRTISFPAGVALDFSAPPSGLLPDGGALDFFPDGSSTGGVVSLTRSGSVARVSIRGLDGQVRLYQ